MAKMCPNVRRQGNGNGQAQPSGLSSEGPKGTLSMHSRLGVNKKALPMS